MTSLWRKWTSLVLAIALIVTLAPTGWVPKASADSSYFQFDNLSTAITAPVEVMTERIDISGSFTGVSANSIGYRVERIVAFQDTSDIDNDGDTTEYLYNVIESTTGTTTPIISNNNSTFLFVAVQLYEGLNRIVVTGVNSAGNTVEGEGFVYYENSPYISKVSLSDGRTLVAGTPLLVGTRNPGIFIDATSAESVTVNGVEAYKGGSGVFVTTSVTLQPGHNWLEIVATNGGKSYTVTRELVFYNNTPTVYDLVATYTDGGNTHTVRLDGNPTVDIPATANVTISGKLAFRKPTQPTLPPKPNVFMKITNRSLNNVVVADLDQPGDINVGNADTTSEANYVVFPFETANPVQLGGEGIFSILITSSPWDSQDANYEIVFTNMDDEAVYIKNVWRLYGATESGGTVSASGRTMFTDNTAVNALPLWLMLETENGVPTEANTDVKAKVNGVSQSIDFDKTFVMSGNPAYRVVRIDTLPAGEVELEFSVGSVKKHYVTFNFNPAPAIRLTNLYNGQVFNSPDGLKNEDIDIRLINFDKAGLKSITVTINGETYSVPNNDEKTELTFDVTTDLVPGPNTIVVAGKAYGVPISTMITVFYFSPYEPKILDMLPVLAGAVDDSAGLVERQGTSNQYVTEEEIIDVLFNASDFESMHVSVDGNPYEDVTLTGTNGSIDTSVPGYKGLLIEENQNPGYKYRLKDIRLPENGGTTSITFTAKRGPVSVSSTITIIRVVPAYRVLSPKLPEEQVIKQNFLDVVIYAPGADRVEINKDVMTEHSSQRYHFTYRVTGLKTGRNTIAFTVFRGSESVKGEFTVTYAADYKPGAQYLAELPSSGKISVFGGNLQLTFPKNTYLKPALDSGQVDSLFDSQPILFGIAETDGRTIKTYFDITSKDIKTISTDTRARNLLMPEFNFALASELYWIDPGYVDVSNPNNYTYVQGDHPYPDGRLNGKIFYNRQYPAEWLKPTQRGEITIKYDPSLRNAAASNLSIWRFDGLQWVNLGGKVDTNKKTVTTTIDEFGFYAVMILRYSYNDIIGHDYARNAVELMFARGIMNRKNDNEFGVYDNITRGEFAQMMVKMLNLELDYDPNNLTFDDVPAMNLSPLWDWRYIETAARKGIIRGKGPRLFLPNETLTREEAAVMIARATNLLKGKENADKDAEQLKKIFTDGGLVDHYAASSVLAVYKAGFITGMPNPSDGSKKQTYRFDPLSNLKRAEAAVIAERVMRKNKLL